MGNGAGLSTHFEMYPRDQIRPNLWGTKWGTKPHVAQPISAKPDLAKPLETQPDIPSQAPGAGS